ncbi:MAG: hypothetical protein AVDCRST_MAG73-1105, partial [uncultured Thermomicrobiales bacterium]
GQRLAMGAGHPRRGARGGARGGPRVPALGRRPARAGRIQPLRRDRPAQAPPPPSGPAGGGGLAALRRWLRRRCPGLDRPRGAVAAGHRRRSRPPPSAV